MTAKNKGIGPKTEGLPVYWQSQIIERDASIMYEDWMWSIAMGRFRWEGLPDTCNERFLEWELLTNGIAAISRDDAGIWWSLRAVMQGAPNAYDNPRAWRCQGISGTPNFDSDWSRGAIVYDNLLRVPLGYKLNYLAKRLALCDRTVDINLQQQHHPLILAVDQSLQSDAESIYRQYSNGEPAILGTKRLREIAESISTIDTNAPFIADKVQTVYANIWTQAYTMLVFDSITEKSDRMIEPEVESMTMPSQVMRYNPLKARREAAEKLNKRFGLNVQVFWAHDWETGVYTYLHDLEGRAENDEGLINGGAATDAVAQ